MVGGWLRGVSFSKCGRTLIFPLLLNRVVSNIYNMSAVLYKIYKHEPKASGCISDTTRTLMLYIAYDTRTSKCSCLSTMLKIKAILAR